MTTQDLSPEERKQANDLRRRAWDRDAAEYEKRIGFFERRLFGSEHRPWAAGQAKGKTLEVAIGTGLNLPFYAQDVELCGIDISSEMLRIARNRAAELGLDIDLEEGDAHHLRWPADTFDTVVCTYSLCNIPDVSAAVAEMRRVLRPGGKLVLVDHIRSSVGPILWFQKLLEMISRRIDGDRMTRRPSVQVNEAGFEIGERARSKAGIIERLVATKPVQNG
jgi:SAM-dependent methyltransferase